MPARLTVSAALSRYQKAHSPPATLPKTAARFGVMAAEVSHLYASFPADRFRGPELKKFRTHLLTDRTCHWTARPLSRGYVNHLIASAVRCWCWLLSEGLVSAQCVATLQAVEPLHQGQGGRETGRVLPPPPGWDRALHHLTSVVRAMTLVQVYGGMRPQDMCGMRRRNLSRSPKEPVEFPGTGRSIAGFRAEGVPLWVYVPTAHKTAYLGKPRAVPLGPRAQAVLAPLLTGLVGDDHVFSPRRSLKETRFAGTQLAEGCRERFDVGQYATLIARAIRRTNKPLVEAGVPADHLIPHWSPHQLRHLAATALGDRLDREHAKALLGHSARGDVIDVYMEQAIGKAGRAAALCG